MSALRTTSVGKPAPVIEEHFFRQATVLSIPLEIGVAMNMSEGQVRRVLSAVERLREQTPAVWAAFGDGSSTPAAST